MQQYQCQVLELEGQAHLGASQFSTEQAANLEAMKQEVERLHAENAEKAKKAQEQHTWQVKEHARLATE